MTDQDLRDAARRRLSRQGPVVVLRRSDEEENAGTGGVVVNDAIDPAIRETPAGGGAAREIIESSRT